MQPETRTQVNLRTNAVWSESMDFARTSSGQCLNHVPKCGDAQADLALRLKQMLKDTVSLDILL